MAEEDVAADDGNKTDQRLGCPPVQDDGRKAHREGERADDSEESGERGQALQPAGRRHQTRSLRPRAGMRPCGRKRRTRVTARKTKASRKTRRSAGSSACRRTVAAPTRKPPSAAPARLPRPPITVPTKAMMT